MAEELYDVVVIGAGPSGLTAGLYAGRARLKTLVLESLAPGGQVANTSLIENYPGFPGGVSGAQLTELMERQAKEFGAEVTAEGVRGIERNSDGTFVISTDGSPIGAKTVILAMGSRPTKLKVPGEAEFEGRGVSYCATCDGALYRDREVIVVGGGDSAVEEAIFLTRFAKTVSIVHRRNALRAVRHLEERAKNNPKIKFVWDSVVEAISGEGRVQSVQIKNVKTGEKSTLKADGIFIYVGLTPNTESVSNFVELDANGFIKTAPDGVATSVPGVFAAGDVRTKRLRQIVTAVADGAVAAMEAERFLSES